MERNEKTKSITSEKMTLREKTEREKDAESGKGGREREAAGERRKDGERCDSQADKLYFFTHADSFFPRATHCAFLTHARGEIPNVQLLLHMGIGMCADTGRLLC